MTSVVAQAVDVRIATLDDIERVVELGTQALAESYPKVAPEPQHLAAVAMELIPNDAATLLVARSGSALGFCAARPTRCRDPEISSVLAGRLDGELCPPDSHEEELGGSVVVALKRRKRPDDDGRLGAETGEQIDGEQAMQSISKPTPAQQELNRAIEIAYRRGDDEQVNALLRAKQVLVQQLRPPLRTVRRSSPIRRPDTERAA